MLFRSEWLLAFLACLLLSGAAASAGAQTLRCGQRVVAAGQDAFEVRRACGEPHSITDRSELEVRGARGPDEIRRERRIEEWVYDRGAGGMVERLTFEDNRLVGVGAVARAAGAGCSGASFARGTDEAVLLSRCGPPSQRTPLYREHVARDPLGNERHVARLHREEWVYPGDGHRLPQRVVLRNGRIERTEALAR